MDELITQLASSDAEERQAAVFELGQTENPEAVPHLISALKDNDLHVRIYATQGLRELKPPAAVGPLCELLAAEANEPLIVSNVCRALGEIKDAKATPTLVELLSDRDPFTRYDAAFALGEIGDSTAIPALEQLLSDDTMPEREGEDGDFQSTIYSVGQQAQRAIEMIKN